MTLRFLAAGDTALTVEIGDRAELGLSLKVQALWLRVMEARLAGVVEAVPTLRSLTVHYDPCLTSAQTLNTALLPLVIDTARGVADHADDAEPTDVDAAAPTRRWLIPACYEPELGPDVEAVAGACGLSPWQVTALHACVSYRVLMLGFLPGHPYIGDLPPPLRVPRRTTPRTAVPPGSVAIATTMSVIYPQESPGGWHIIARTPARLFDVHRAEPSLLAPGDEIRFRPINRDEFDALSAASSSGAWSLQPEEAR